MPDYAYVARDTSGQKVTGSVTASSERDAINVLSSRELFPVQVSEQAKRVRFGGSRVKAQTMAIIYSQLSGLLRAGVPLLRAIGVLRDQAANARLKEVLMEVHNRVEEGETLAEGMSRFPRVFNDMAVNLVRAGTEGGFLEEALERIAQFTEEQEDLKARTIGALAYPMFLGAVGSAIVAALVIFFVPKFGALFDTLRDRGELPAMTDWLLWVSDTIRSWGLFIVIGMVFIFALVRAQLYTEDGKRFRDLAKLKMPLLGIIFRHLAVARFCRVLGTLLHNGVPILRSLDISREAAGNRILSSAIEAASENISAGESLAKPLGISGHFPVTVVEMIAVAEESNTLDKVLIDIAEGLEKRTSRRLDLAVRLLEPMMLLVLAGAVLVVVIALLLPVIKMSSAM